jgi:hypothetical protein
MEGLEPRPSFEVFKSLELHVLINRPRSTKKFPFEFELGNILVQEMGSYAEGSRNPST